MVGIVQSVHQIAVERVDVLESREAIEDGLQLLSKRLGRKFDLSRVELMRVSVENDFLPKLCGFRTARILLIWNPARICVGSRRCVLLRTMSKNS